MKNVIPGHVRALTIWLAIWLALGAFLETGNWSKTGLVILMVFGIFIADQATHLAQEDHSASPPTAIERIMQRNRLVCVLFGSCVAMVAFISILR